MPISPEIGSGDRREIAARRMLHYLERLPMGTEARLELALDVLRSLPGDAGPDQALRALRTRLPGIDPAGFPPDHPPLERGHMPGQDLDRRHLGLRHMLARWYWLLFPALLLALTLFLNSLR